MTASTNHALLPVSKAEYYAAGERKHFGAQPVGSVFTDATVSGFADLLELTVAQRGSLDGDDRDLLIGLGADAGAFMPSERGVRYLLVRVAGEVGLVQASSLPSTAQVTARATKPGVPCSLTVAGVPRQTSEIATVILGPDPEAPESTVLYTAHPGLPIAPAQDEVATDGEVLTVEQVLARIGDVFLLVE